ncbi:MAG: hypothetical protein ACOVQA_05025 [Thermoflexibacteraceae bacterium]
MATSFKIASQYGYHHPSGETNTQPSQTVPDQSMSVSEIMRRYAQGLPMAGYKVPTYSDDENQDLNDVFPNIKKLDLAELQELKLNTAIQIKELTKKAKQEEQQRSLDAAKKQQQDEQARLEKIAKELNKLNRQKDTPPTT